MMFHIIPDSSFNQKHKGIVCLKVLPFRRIWVQKIFFQPKMEEDGKHLIEPLKLM